MSRQDFLQRLRDTLTGEVSSGVIEENIRYYDDYIRTEAAKGQTEEAVIEAIGDPRLIAKTIMDAAEDAEDSDSRRSAAEENRAGSQTVYEERADGGGRPTHFIDLNKWYWKLLAVAVPILVFFVIISVVTSLFSLLMPLLGPIFLILMVVWIFKGLRR